MKLYNDISKIKTEFLQSGLMWSKRNINAATVKALSVDYQSAINNACLETRINNTNLDLNLVIEEARHIYEIQSLGKKT